MSFTTFIHSRERNVYGDFLNQLIPKGNTTFSANWFLYRNIAMLILTLGKEPLLSENWTYSKTFFPVIDRSQKFQGAASMKAFIENNGISLTPFPKAVALKVERISSSSGNKTDKISDLSIKTPDKTVEVQVQIQEKLFHFFAVSLIPDTWRGEEDLKGFCFEIPRCMCFRGHEKHESSLIPALNEQRSKTDNVVHRVLELSRSQKNKFSPKKAEEIWNIWQKIQPIIQDFRTKRINTNQLEQYLKDCLKGMLDSEKKIIELNSLEENSTQNEYRNRLIREWEQRSQEANGYFKNNLLRTTEELQELSIQSAKLIKSLQELSSLSKTTSGGLSSELGIDKEERDDFPNRLSQALRDRKKIVIEDGHHSSSGPTLRFYCHQPLDTEALLLEAFQHTSIEFFEDTSICFLKIDFSKSNLRNQKIQLLNEELAYLKKHINPLESYEKVEEKINSKVASKFQSSVEDKSEDEVDQKEEQNLFAARDFYFIKQNIEELETLNNFLLEQQKNLSSLENTSKKRKLHSISEEHIKKLVERFSEVHKEIDGKLIGSYKDKSCDLRMLELLIERFKFTDQVLLVNGLLKKTSGVFHYMQESYAKQRYIFDQQVILVIWNLMINLYETGEEDRKSSIDKMKSFFGFLKRKTMYTKSSSTPKTSFEKLKDLVGSVFKDLPQFSFLDSHQKSLEVWMKEVKDLDVESLDQVIKLINRCKEIQSELIQDLEKQINLAYNREAYEQKKTKVKTAIHESMKMMEVEQKKLFGKFLNLLEKKVEHKSAKTIKDFKEKIQQLKESLGMPSWKETEYSAQIAQNMEQELSHVEAYCVSDDIPIIKENAEAILKEIEKISKLDSIAQSMKDLSTFIENYLEQKKYQEFLTKLESLTTDLNMDTFFFTSKEFKTFVRACTDNITTNPYWTSNETHVPAKYFLLDKI